MEVNLAKVWADPANVAFKVARSDAIQEYANLEQSLCDLLAHAGDMKPIVAGAIFFKMVNARSRMRVLEQLMKLKHKDGYKVFMKSVSKLVHALDQERNTIVHWHMSADVMAGDDGQIQRVDITLSPPNFWDTESEAQNIGIGELVQFCAKCQWVSTTINTFVSGLSDKHPQHGAWQDRYQQPLTYPPQIAPPRDPTTKA